MQARRHTRTGGRRRTRRAEAITMSRRNRWLKWIAISLGIFLVVAGTARSIRTRNALAALERIEAEDVHAHDAALAQHARHAHRDAHMKWTSPHKMTASDEIRAQQIVETLRASLEPYRDYKAAVRDGFYPFAPDVPQRMYHFTHGGKALRNAFSFDAARPTSLLYKKTERGFELMGAMYTAPRRLSEERLNERAPLSIGKWHQHVNICQPPAATPRDQADWSRFGPDGSIATEKDCSESGGRWRPQIFGWMLHVYPFEATQEKIWTH